MSRLGQAEPSKADPGRLRMAPDSQQNKCSATWCCKQNGWDMNQTFTHTYVYVCIYIYCVVQLEHPSLCDTWFGCVSVSCRLCVHEMKQIELTPLSGFMWLINFINNLDKFTKSTNLNQAHWRCHAHHSLTT